MVKSLTTVALLLIFLLNPVSVFAATLSLVPSSGTANRGCSFALNIELDTQGAATDGTDAILIYDKTRFSAASNAVTNGAVYPDYPGSEVNSTTGRITVSGLASVNEAFVGKGVFATINFSVPTTAPTGAATLKFDFDPANKTKTTDSNVVQRDTIADVLSSVVDGNYTIGTGTCAQQTLTTTPGLSKPQGQATSSGSSTGSSSKNLDQLVGGKTGTTEFTYTVGIVGSILVILGILGMVLL